MAPAVSIVVVGYRQRDALLECLDACAAAGARTPGGAELIVVDNGGLAEIACDHHPEARVVEPGENIGFAAAVNRGVSVARGRWVALVNDDALIETDALAAALEAGERDERVGTVATQVRFRSAPGVMNSAGIEVDLLGIAVERLAGQPVAAAAEACEVFGGTGCFALYRAAMLQEVGCLEPRFFAYLEDADLAWRARAAGWTAVYEPRAIAYHQASSTTGHGSAAKYFLAGRNRMWLLARNATTRQLLGGLLGILLYDVGYVAFVAASDHTLAPLRGRLAGLREWRQFRAESRDRRRPVQLRPATRGWMQALRMHRAYRARSARAAAGHNA